MLLYRVILTLLKVHNIHLRGKECPTTDNRKTHMEFLLSMVLLSYILWMYISKLLYNNSHDQSVKWSDHMKFRRFLFIMHPSQLCPFLIFFKIQRFFLLFSQVHCPQYLWWVSEDICYYTVVSYKPSVHFRIILSISIIFDILAILFVLSEFTYIDVHIHIK